ncbi:adaptin ear-binding coat-associated protein 1 [Clonorchis sinensis]|uniref:Adaptin ear-binding coat-associated protein 1 n=1 Tax=Clonorchis sinensis TaxID=79923 RepID=G7YV25_CLOSI|nr:adaptin ear-binding coat-associated protein 1 [Clonorchis sinensis]
MDYENVLLVKNEVYIYQIPPRQSNRGYRAADWGLDTPFWTGRLRIVAKGKDLTLKLEDRNSGELYAKCPVDAFPGIAVESVMDSSRYFVIRLMADDGRTMYTGLGFAERSDSFDFNVTIQDHFKWVQQEKEVAETEEKLKSQPSLNLGFKEGQTIKLNLNTRRTGDDPSVSGESVKPKQVVKLAGGSTAAGLLPPPPAPSMSRSRGTRGAALSGATHTVTTAPVVEGSNLLDGTTPCHTSANQASNVDLLADIFGPAKVAGDTQNSNEAASVSWSDFH